jgi:hypothetical protein
MKIKAKVPPPLGRKYPNSNSNSKRGDTFFSQRLPGASTAPEDS